MDKEEILKYFDEIGIAEKNGWNKSPKKIMIFTRDIKKCDTAFADIILENFNDVKKCQFNKGERYVELENGNCFLWFKNFNFNHGHKCDAGYIDENLDELEDLCDIVFPVCYYCSRKDIVVI